MLVIILTIVHVIVAVFLILVVLLQTGKRADLAGAFGGGGSQTAFGTRGAATLLSKLTTGAAVMFMVTSLSLSLLASREAVDSGGSVLPEDQPAQTQPAPGDPATQPGFPAGEPTPDPATTPAQDPIESTPLSAEDPDGSSEQP